MAVDRRKLNRYIKKQPPLTQGLAKSKKIVDLLRKDKALKDEQKQKIKSVLTAYIKFLIKHQKIKMEIKSANKKRENYEDLTAAVVKRLNNNPNLLKRIEKKSVVPITKIVKKKNKPLFEFDGENFIYDDPIYGKITIFPEHINIIDKLPAFENWTFTKNIFKGGYRNTANILAHITLDNGTVLYLVMKEGTNVSPRNPWKTEAEKAKHMRSVGLSVERPLGLWETNYIKSPFKTNEKEPVTYSIFEHLRGDLVKLTKSQRENLNNRAMDDLAKMVKQGVVHGDFAPRHYMYRQEGKKNEVRIIDVETARKINDYKDQFIDLNSYLAEAIVDGVVKSDVELKQLLTRFFHKVKGKKNVKRTVDSYIKNLDKKLDYELNIILRDVIFINPTHRKRFSNFSALERMIKKLEKEVVDLPKTAPKKFNRIFNSPELVEKHKAFVKKYRGRKK